MSRNKPGEFFKNQILDNNQYSLKDYLDLNRWDLSRLVASRAGEDRKKEEIFKFIVKLRGILQSKQPHIISFGEEFEENFKEVFSFEGKDFDTLKIYTNNIIGTILYDGVIFNIGSRFGEQFLQYMIASSEGFLEYEDFGQKDKDLGLAEWLLIYYWKVLLKKAFRLGLYKSYSEIENDLSSLRGRVDFAHIHKFQHSAKLRCYYREHSYLNAINEVIRRALIKISNINKYDKLIADLTPIKRAYFDLKSINVSLKSLKNHKIRNPFYLPYQEVYELSLQILENRFFNFGAISDFNALLFDISMLFEHHIRKLLIHNGFTIEEKNSKKYFIPNGIGVSPIYPDIVIVHEDGSISVYDVKYKNFNSKVEREDRFQIVSYAALLSSHYKEVKECGIIYPVKGYKEKLTQDFYLCDKKTQFNVVFYPVCEDNDGFKEKQQRNDERFLAMLEK